MGRHRTFEEKVELRLKAIAMREAGIGSKRIARELGVGGKLICEFLRGTPVPGSLTRPQAKDDLREAALLLRGSGRTYEEIATELGVSKGSLSLWLSSEPFPTDEQRSSVSAGATKDPGDGVQSRADIARALRGEGWLLREIAEAMGTSTALVFRWTKRMPVPARAVHGGNAEHMRMMLRSRWDATLAERDLQRQAAMSSAAARVGELTARELELIAVTAYWCEGSKSKPWRRIERLTFMNMDPGLIRLWLVWLRSMGVTSDRLRFRIQIHESADLAVATDYWSAVVEHPAEEFSTPTIKRHNPKTVRYNTGDQYFGCLSVNVLQGRDLYQTVAGVWRGIVDSLESFAPGVVDRA